MAIPSNLVLSVELIKPFAEVVATAVVVALTPGSPLGPCGPVAPVSPLGPCEPCDPVAPFSIQGVQLLLV